MFDEGLRIAQQYGMEDFAEELKGLQEPEKEDNQEPANIPNIPTFNQSNGQSSSPGGDILQNSVMKNTTNGKSQSNHVISDSSVLGKPNDIPVNGDT